MSIQIKMADEYSTVTTYYGQLDKKYAFMVETSYNSEIDNHCISSIEFIAEKDLYNDKSKKYWRRAEDKVRDFVTKWLFERVGGEDDSKV
tara:strand:- start:2142 stop:2411 length:270 start_codon:yes stop_codon:yes gene_type:complete